MRNTVIVGGSRTPFGKLGGILKQAQAVQLGAAAIDGALQSNGQIARTDVEGVLMGMVLQGGAGQNPARQAAVLAGLPWSTPSETVNKVCASGMRAITLADQMIRCGDAELLIAGGMESMSNAPYAIPDARWGARMGDRTIIDLMHRDGLHCPFDQVAMAVYGNDAALQFHISRTEQDEWALRSQQLAVAAINRGAAAEEIVPVAALPGAPDKDECPRPNTDAAQLARLKPIGGSGGTVTAGNAPGVNDGAAAVVVMDKAAALRGGYKPLAEIAGHAAVALEPHRLAEAPALAMQKLFAQTGVSLAAIDLIEVNEAFAAVTLTCGRLLGWQPDKVNVNGGAIAYGHPIGASGARIVWTLIQELRRRGGGLGVAAICSGGAQGDALLLRVEG
ncbi:acetyl-CoA C-acetyltransferase [Paenibacillus sp. NPDC058174]|uniref:acetyl-CoA C-acetyltransferase n=1 Tax=Paenibacillus sp. NPDC058174 TaxID=3346366 RepID=UPI0036DD34CF